ncbi:MULTISPECIES: TrmH family RNA methyltransferase [unclassified Butyrivibrio]|jgi:TrmH family RNA methyltransferase|uniref:TrmH family RNA methyltransferase n=1 Tax=unclassified Butyrivibrio TaxID=2639466 RepID=UPI0003B777D5|nr:MULTISPECIES: RNA methyltransferase [unclassified Butyrivibrio]MBE5838470.1 RNA methyltransferase [Butyrivibrio sp.]SEF59171.1 RNA methyltransferase, TrmH family [Butyrivibrio sp. Su6]
MITSTNNDRVKQVVAYVQKSKARKDGDVFVIEGMKMLREAPVLQVREVYVTGRFLDKATEEDKEILWRYGAEEVSDDVMKKMADTQTPQGVLAVVSQYHYTEEEVLEGYNKDDEGAKPLILILENIQDPGNLGTMLRSGEGAGVTGVILSKGSADIYNPKVIRSTMGSIFRMPFIYVENLAEMIKKLSANGINTYAAHLKGTKNYDEFDYTKPTAFLVGNEGNGLTKETADAATEYILIPMKGEVESMNAATSAAILTFEASRQRRG